MKKISSSNTKKEILEAYQDLLNIRKETEKVPQAPRKSVPAQPSPPVSAKRIQPINKIPGLEEIQTAMSDFKRNFSTVLISLEDSLLSEVKRLDSIRVTIKEDEARLAELHAIDVEAVNLEKIRQAQSEQKAAFEKEIAGIREDWKREKNERERLSKEEEARWKEEMKRRDEEATYTYQRQKRHLEDALEEELEKKRKKVEEELQTRTEELLRREAAVKEQEDHLKNLQKEVDAFPRKIQAVLEETEERAVRETEERLKMEKLLLEKDRLREKELFELTLSGLKEKIKEQEARVKSLEKDLREAYETNKNLAARAIEGMTHAPHDQRRDEKAMTEAP